MGYALLYIENYFFSSALMLNRLFVVDWAKSEHTLEKGGGVKGYK
jgi:hypothetical protein